MIFANDSNLKIVKFLRQHAFVVTKEYKCNDGLQQKAAEYQNMLCYRASKV